MKIRHVAASVTLAAAALSTAHAETSAAHGYFFVGGHYVESGGKRLMAGQMYVEYITPEKVTHPWPIVMIHGTAQTGTNFTGTPERPARLGGQLRGPRLARLRRRPGRARAIWRRSPGLRSLHAVRR